MTHRLRAHERGVAAIEFALILPLLVLMLFGMVEFSRGYNAKITATHAAREGVRAHVLGGDAVAAANAASTNLTLSSVSVSGPCVMGEPASVTVSIAVDYDIPLFASGTFNVSDTGTMRCEVSS